MAPSVSHFDVLQSPQSSNPKGFHSTTALDDQYSVRHPESVLGPQTPLSRHDRHMSQSNLVTHQQQHSFSGDDTEDDTIPYIFPDFQALEAIFSKTEYKSASITGFEIYIVEQWACERRYSTVITSYTGDSLHKVRAGRVRLPRDTSKWSDKLRRFIEEIEDSGAKLKETVHGYMFITNLSAFPSNLNLIPIASGCVADVWDVFKVNVNLRRMNCGGRSALFLCSPSDACEDKFRQIYKTHPKVDITYAAKELVTLVQICLVDFKLLDPLFVDGLLCNKTEEKIMEWWNIFGSLYYGVTPKDGILGPTTVAAILGFVLSCHYRLDMASVDFPKEPFNYFSFRVNVGKFQKAYNLTRTWYLDPITVEKLFRVTSKISTSDISKLKKAVKSTVHDISGKLSSEQSAREVLTTDLERAIKYFNCSPRLEYLWFGKGDCRDLKQFDYYIARSPQSALMSASTLRSGVGKIKGLPKKLQVDDISQLNFTSAVSLSQRSKKDQEQEGFDQVCVVPTEEEGICLVYGDDCKAALNGGEIKLLTDDETFKHSLTRRLSFPYLASEVNTPQLEYENHFVDMESSLSKGCILKRSKSFSFVEEAVLTWESNVLVPEVVAARIKAIERDSMRNKLEWKAYCQEMRAHKSDIDSSKSSLFKMAQRTKPLFDKCDLQLQADERFHLKLDDIAATGARLEYEMRLLSTRVRDAQDSVESFVGKVDQLEASINALCPMERLRDRFGSNCDAPIGPYKINKERIGKVWGMIQQFGVVKWATCLMGSMEAAVVENKLDGKASELEDFAIDGRLKHS